MGCLFQFLWRLSSFWSYPKSAEPPDPSAKRPSELEASVSLQNNRFGAIGRLSPFPFPVYALHFTEASWLLHNQGLLYRAIKAISRCLDGRCRGNDAPLWVAPPDPYP